MYETGCKCKEQTRFLKVEADFCADSIWCNNCQSNLDLSRLALSNKLKRELSEWALEFGKWLKLDTDELVSNAKELEDAHNVMGAILCEKVKEELGNSYMVFFTPSSLVRSYSQKLL
ncbi:hypothetical protein [Desulfosporosinus meridiei]|uniref:Uncharacterized protein n=1 Tax=Desulfosporosinus meridiei (strain ATCC BAA-275 / DSM 13257 / KCTC 12902 / NCIMB 13706 / S10) TaxID=768704 RepID=J7IV23_DESMD|nr:hypothetical protein [Desulfosporosinus meridiei]AFQ43999.1 hypothetical protein Desmer_2059 [Desulfosporosinus meridiei DSM 13257]